MYSLFYYAYSMFIVWIYVINDIEHLAKNFIGLITQY